MKDSERFERFNALVEETCMITWTSVKDMVEEETFLVGMSEGVELSTMFLEVAGFMDEGRFDMKLWEKEMKTFQGLPLCFCCIAFPYTKTTTGEQFFALAMMDSIASSFTRINIGRDDDGELCAISGEAFIPFDDFSELLPVLRHAVTPQG